MAGGVARTVHLVFDACDRDLVRDLIAAGELPAIASHLDASAVVDTEAPVGLFVSSVWPTQFLATTVARHGYHCWDRIDPVTYAHIETSPDEILGTPMWDVLSEQGHRVAVLDVPHTRVRSELNGVMLVEWGCHDRHFGTHSWPADLVSRLASTVGPHPVGSTDVRSGQFAPCDYLHREGPHRTEAELARLLEDLLVGIDRKAQATLELLARGSWDLFMSVFGEAHCVGHQFWMVHDPRHPWHDPTVAARLRDPLRTIYRRLDRVLGSVLESVDADTTVALQLSHGMGPHYDGTHLLDLILHRLERVATAGPAVGWRSRLARAATAMVPVDRRRSLYSAASPLLRRRVASRPPGPLERPDVDRSARLFYAAPNNTVVGGVRINLVGRESKGMVDADEALALCRWLADELRQIVDIDSGRPLVERVDRTDEVLTRPLDDDLPDLLIGWRRQSMISRVWSPSIGTVVQPPTHWRTGDHHSGGMFAIRGPGITPGRRHRALQTIDISPTIAATLGAELPNVDGRPRADLLPGGSVPSPFSRPWGLPQRSDRSELRTQGRFDVLARQLEGLSRAHHVTRSVATGGHDRAANAQHHVTELRSHATHLETMAHQLAARVDRLEDVLATMAWVAHLPPREELLVTVIMPTRDRLDRLRAAIESVTRQRHTRWELLVVDDRSRDGTAEFLADLDDPRIRCFQGPGLGCGAARNVALSAAMGDVICYLDDDNVFHPDWLVALSWTFARRPDVEVVYGARVIEDRDRVHGRPAGGLPFLHLEAWDRVRLEAGNIADMNVIAHRPCDVRFDERIDYFTDWDLFLRLSERSKPEPLPVIASLYFTSSEGRMSDSLADEERKQQTALIQEGVATRSRAPRRSG